MFGGIVDAATSVVAPVASGLLRRTPWGMAISAGVAAVGSGIKYGKDGDLSLGDWGNIALDTVGNVAGSALGPLAPKGLGAGVIQSFKTAPNGQPLKKMLKDGAGLLADKSNVTKAGKFYAGVGSFLGYRPGDVTGAPGMGGPKQVPTRAAGSSNAA